MGAHLPGAEVSGTDPAGPGRPRRGWILPWETMAGAPGAGPCRQGRGQAGRAGGERGAASGGVARRGGSAPEGFGVVGLREGWSRPRSPISFFLGFDHHSVRFALSGAASAGRAVIFVFDARLTRLVTASNQFLEIMAMFKGIVKKNRVSFVSCVSGIM